MLIRQNSPERESQITQSLRWWKSEHGRSTEADTTVGRRGPSRFPTYRVIIDEEIDANDDPLGEPPGSVDPAQPNCTVLRRINSINKYEQTTQRLPLSNESDESYAVDDAAWAVFQDGKYIVTGCPMAVTNRPTPPWDGGAS